MNNYEQMCLELDCSLALALGWDEVTVTNTVNGINTGGFYSVCNRWTQDDGEAFRLMVEHEIKAHVNKTWDEAIADHTVLNTQDYSTDKAALRVAIVKSVIAKLSQ